MRAREGRCGFRGILTCGLGATVVSRREISYTRLLISEHSKQNPPRGRGVSFDQYKFQSKETFSVVI